MPALRLRFVAGADGEGGDHAGGLGGVQFIDEVADEEDVLWRQTAIVRDGGVARGFAFGAGGGVVVAGEARGEVASGGVGEEKALGVDAAGGVDADFAVVFTPVVERGQDIVKERAAQVAAAEALLPDEALELLQAGDFGIGIHEAMQGGFGIERIEKGGHAGIACELGDDLMAPVRPEPGGGVLPRIRKHHVMNKGEWRDGALDVEQDEFAAKLDHAVRVTACSMWMPLPARKLGPKQSGW